MLNFSIRPTECHVLFVQEHKLFLAVASYIILPHKPNKFETKNTQLFSKQHTVELFECCCQDKNTAYKANPLACSTF